MKIETLLTTQDKDGKAYYTDLARVVESIRLGTKLSNGRCLKEELTADEKTEVENYVMKKLLPIIKPVARKKAALMQLDYSKEEEYIDLVIIETYEQFHKFNSEERVEKKGKTYEVATYIGILAQNVIKKFIAAEREIPVNAVRNLDVVSDAVIEISMEHGISMNMVTVEQVAEKLKDKSISNKMISDLLGLMSGNIPIDDIPDTDVRLQDNTVNVEDNIVVDMAPGVKKKLDNVFDKFSDLELFILMKEYGFFGDDIRKLTAKELSYKDFFVELARADRSGVKNIEFGNVKIQRPGRSSGIVEEVLVESVYYVKEKFYSNKVAKIKKQLFELSHEMDVDDLKGNLEDYCKELWAKRQSK